MFSLSFCKLFLQQIAVILQHEIQNSKTKIYIASFKMTLELGYLKGGYVNFGLLFLDFCNLLYMEPHTPVRWSLWF